MSKSLCGKEKCWNRECVKKKVGKKLLNSIKKKMSFQHGKETTKHIHKIAN